MPRFRRRRFASSRPLRQTNWLASLDMSVNLAADSFQTISVLRDPAAGGELDVYTNPTLVRTRGVVTADPGFSVPSGSSFAMGLACLWFGTGAAEITWDSTQGVVLDGALSSDSILWFSMYRFGQYRQDTAGSSSVNLQTALTQNVWRDYVDIKAQRKFEDNRDLFITFVNFDISLAQIDFGYALRCLVKE